LAISEKEDTIQLIGFNVGRRLFGTDILTIREILREPEINILEECPVFVEGVVRLRGEEIPVIDLKRRLGDPHKRSQIGSTWLMIANAGDRTAGFLVDAVTRILKINPDDILPPPELILEGLPTPYIHGVCTTQDGMLVVLNFDRLLAPDEISELNQMEMRR
jgi:purine-binding chemotaxis protein CheW